MPHLTVEYTVNLPDLDAAALLDALNAALAGSGEFDEADIKSRAQRLDVFRIGTTPAARGFVHARLALLAGRSAETKRALSAAMLAVLQAEVAAPAGVDVQLCAEVVDIDRDSYAKALVP
ncbi:MAG TPA: 5-carboxymethyl-2-hydroxymuconate Delta-isomerase [Lysobacter sp.]|nr:5-carboxymethyl-2-hydroxymuconate Delta-isomerase [Lysobacter sp.]